MRVSSSFAFVGSLAALLLSGVAAHSQDALVPHRNDVLVPDTSVVRASDRGLFAHTNHLIGLRPQAGGARGGPGGVTPAGGLGPGGGMTPAQIRSFYQMPSSGGSGIIAIVDAYHYNTALNDFNVFSRQFGLPVETSTSATASTNTVFQVVYATGSKPQANGGWAQEEALDIEWAHAMAPNAKIILVEARSASYTDLFAAVDKAVSLGAKQISMSWGGSEFSGETSYDSHFPQNRGVVFFASSGDTGGVVEYPSCSPFVVAAGGTSVATNSSGVFTGETGWSGSGGGNSAYEAKPAFQSGVAGTGSRRSVPDISADADPNTGVAVYDSTRYGGVSGWLVFGGTSVACPCLAGMANVSGNKYSSSQAELGSIYSILGTGNARDITSGHAGSFSCAVGWDFVTGVGTPQGTVGL